MQRSAECLSSPTTSPLVIRGLKMLMLLTQSLLIHIKLEKIARLERLAHTVYTHKKRTEAPRQTCCKPQCIYRETQTCKDTQRNMETDTYVLTYRLEKSWMRQKSHNGAMDLLCHSSVVCIVCFVAFFCVFSFVSLNEL